MSSDVVKPTPRQTEALENAFERGSPWQGPGGRFVRNAGGSFRRMVDDLRTRKLLDSKLLPTARGLRALRTRKLKEPDFVARLDAKLVIAEAEEERIAQVNEANRAELARHNAARRAAARVKRIAALRELFATDAENFRKVGLPEIAGSLAELGERLTDEELLAFVDRIVSRDIEL